MITKNEIDFEKCMRAELRRGYQRDTNGMDQWMSVGESWYVRD